MFHVELVTDLAAANELRADWDALLRATPQATFFRSFDWLETYWRFYGAEQSLRILVVRHGPKTVGIVPLTILRETTKLGRMRILTYPLAYWGSYYGPIGPRPRETLAAALEYLGSTRRDWDMLDLRFTPAPDCDPAGTQELMARANFGATPKRTDFTSFIDLPESLDAYLSTRPAKWRTNFRRWSRRITDLGTLHYERYRPVGGNDDGAPRWELYDDCERVAQRSWQGSSTNGTTLTHEPVRAFFRAMHATACRAGAADINLLYLNDRPCAFLYCYRYGEALFGCRTGFDAEAAKAGVGNLMYLKVVEDSIRRGDRTIDLGPGSLPAKKPLLSRIAPIYRLPYANGASWRGMAWRMKQAIDDLQNLVSAYDDESIALDEALRGESPRTLHQLQKQGDACDREQDRQEQLR